MRWVLITALLLLSACALLPKTGTESSPLEVNGVLNGKTVLRGYVVVTGDLLVPAGSHLEIRRGSTVVIRNSESTKIDPEYLSSQTEILIRGTLVVAGEPDAVVRFVPETPAPAGDTAWAGIILDRASDSVISHASLLQADTGILIVNASPEVTGNTITGSRYGIIAQGGSAKILGNTISGGEAGIFCWNDSQAYLKDNIIVGNDEEGIVVDRSSKPYVDRNTVSGNDIGLVIPESVPYDPVMIKNNRVDIKNLARRGELSK